MKTVRSVEELTKLYDEAAPVSVEKVAQQITPCYRAWIEGSRFLVLTTVGPEGTDASPRGDDGPVVSVPDPQTILLPDWRGNNRLDSLRNIVRDGRVSLMFMVPGCNNVVRVNGQAVLCVDEKIRQRFEKRGALPRTVIAVTVGDLYFQCAKALMRSGLWRADDESQTVPTAGAFIKEFKAGFDAIQYDDGYAEYAKGRMW